jgi:lauroyl/myristoyl acyltransferase
MVRWLAVWLISPLAWAGFYVLRWGERLLPHTVLRALLWLPAAAWGLAELRGRRMAAAYRRFPEAWRPEPISYFLRRVFGHPHARLVYTWPDRLRSPPWSNHCQLEQNEYLNQLRAQDKGVVLASLHFGPFETLPYWLRAHGIAATTLLGRPNAFQSLKRRQYALSAPVDVPVFLPVSHLPHVRQFLGHSGRPLVMVDVNRGKQVYVPFDNYLFRMATGAIRLAALADAELIPCLIIETASWQFTIRFGTPVPRSYLGRSPNLNAAAAHLLQEFFKIVPFYPEQCGRRLVSCISLATKHDAQRLSSELELREDRGL